MKNEQIAFKNWKCTLSSACNGLQNMVPQR